MSLFLDLNFKQAFAQDEFFFGVANAPYLCEGGYNTPDGPKNSFGYFEADGLVPPSGEATRFWTNYEQHIALAASHGLNAFRLGVEWARVQPTLELAPGEAPEWDIHALDHYARILAAIYRHGLEPILTLHHFTHPAWLGRRFWSEDRSAQIAVDYEVRVTRELNTRLRRSGHPPIRNIITFNELNLTPPKVLTGTMRHSSNTDAPLHEYDTVYDNILSAHVGAYDGIKHLYEANNWGECLIGFGSATQAPYELDRAVLDVVRVRSEGLDRHQVRGHLARCRAKWNARLAALAMRQLTDDQFVAYEEEVQAVRADVDPMRWTKTLDAVYASPREDKLDYLSANIYEPFRTGRAAGNANDAPRWWEFAMDGDIYRSLILAYNEGNRTLPMFMGENSIAYQQPLDGAASPRADGWTRERYFKTYLMEIARCIHEGVPIRGYLYWSLVDDFEWDAGFTPRLGLHNYDYENHLILETDGLGEPSGQIFADLVAALRTGDQRAIQKAFVIAHAERPVSHSEPPAKRTARPPAHGSSVGVR